ncbi:D-alanyl-D-alanine carboxypeptidase [Azospirillum sp. RWY-5-1]|uniref:D-alanyl-D-alanine carboxypeptidase n=1 Tax=Azospirillum oleiclasticum TaxID=2735135 RepID=A0ABX2T3G3_9PROT|nr:D-alanyl-D-alanine carboxypeptidase [Azospirillum oleiclasticum]NYZ11632.1 D-alanyl-D-alanine carboxypeptidase [Azospirillum oleiclasticum]NYZ18793.1 D-alanyl-D-alanine carboxypeptidase [Azospirillum oleiclasticum]
MTVTPRVAFVRLLGYAFSAWAGSSSTAPRKVAAALFAGMLTLGAVPALAEKYAAFVMDARTGEVLHQDNADDIRHPASLTKMMTLYLTFEALDSGKLTLDQRLPVSSFAESMAPTKLGVRVGQTLAVEHAILGLVTKSANDAAVVLAEAIGGTESQFAEMMTRRARQLGMRSTVFRNASGLPNDEQVTTARDFAMLGRALVQDHPKYYPYFSRRSFAYGGRNLPNHNRLMSRYDGMDGIKTGYINASGFNLVGSAVRDGRRLVAVVMGGKSAVARDNRMAALLDDAFSRGRRSDPDAPVVARAEPTERPVTVAAVSKSIPAAQPDRKPAPARGIGQLAAAVVPPPADDAEWGIQVGAFSSKASGQKALSDASRKVPRGVKSEITQVPTRKGTVYRARFVGMEEKVARSLCDRLRRAGLRCVPVSPSEGL